MAKKVRVQILDEGAVEVLRSQGVQQKIAEIVKGIAARANAAEETPRADRKEVYGFEATVIGSPHSRAGGRVTAVGPSARRRNAKNNTILKAMGGG